MVGVLNMDMSGQQFCYDNLIQIVTSLVILQRLQVIQDESVESPLHHLEALKRTDWVK